MTLCNMTKTEIYLDTKTHLWCNESDDSIHFWQDPKTKKIHAAKSKTEASKCVEKGMLIHEA